MLWTAPLRIRTPWLAGSGNMTLTSIDAFVQVTLWPLARTSISVEDPGSGAFLTPRPGSGIRNRFFPDLGYRNPNPYF
jgi:hypothetical protein